MKGPLFCPLDFLDAPSIKEWPALHRPRLRDSLTPKISSQWNGPSKAKMKGSEVTGDQLLNQTFFKRVLRGWHQPFFFLCSLPCYDSHNSCDGNPFYDILNRNVPYLYHHIVKAAHRPLVSNLAVSCTTPSNRLAYFYFSGHLNTSADAKE